MRPCKSKLKNANKLLKLSGAYDSHLQKPTDGPAVWRSSVNALGWGSLDMNPAGPLPGCMWLWARDFAFLPLSSVEVRTGQVCAQAVLATPGGQLHVSCRNNRLLWSPIAGCLSFPYAVCPSSSHDFTWDVLRITKATVFWAPTVARYWARCFTRFLHPHKLTGQG